MSTYRRYNMNILQLENPSVSVPLYLQLSGADGTIVRRRILTDELATEPVFLMSDEFLMYTYKVRRCPRNKSHNWTECPYAHRGEKARRRDPRKFPYIGVACPEFRHLGDCMKGQNCEFAHGVFEFWLHPSRYRTRLCEAGLACPRRICFFAHTPQQLRPEGGGAHCSSSSLNFYGHATSSKLDMTRTRSSLGAPNMLQGSSSKEVLVKDRRSELRAARVEEELGELHNLEWILDLVK